MSIEIYRPTKNGTHTFDPYNFPSPFAESTHKKIDALQEEDLKKFNKDIYSDLSDKGKIKIFFFAEYIKRKFYLDCMVEKDNKGNYKKNKVQKLELYIDKKFTDIQSFIDEIPSLYNNKERKNLIFNLNINGNRSEFFDAYVSFNHENLYYFIRDTYFYYLQMLIDIIKNPFKHFDSRISCHESNLLKILSDKEYSLYEYERILYYLAKYAFSIQQNCKDQFIIVKIINKYLPFKFNHSLLEIYRDIVDNYSLYPSHLFEMTSMTDIIFNDFQLNKISRFFFLPKEIKIDNPLEDISNCVLDNLSGKLNISIDLSLKEFDSTEISKYVSEQIILASYVYKEDTQKKYTEQEIKKFCSYIDTYSKNNEIDNLKERAISLYIWDLIYIHKKRPSISEHITRIYEKINKTITIKDKRNYQRYVASTLQCIENKDFFSLA